MATTFHKFPLLPRELRDEVWCLAIRSRHRGVQIFQLHKTTSPKLDGSGSTPLKDHLLKICKGIVKPFVLADGSIEFMSGEHNRPWCFGAPLESKNYDGRDGSPHKNISTYMIDFGLWTACKESRRVIRKHFANPSNNPWGLPERGRVTYCSGSNPFYLSVWPGSDLFILQFENFSDTNWSRIEAFAGTPKSSPCPVEPCRDIGIEYDSIWKHSAFGPWYDEIFAADFLFSFSLKRRLWLVDTNLKRKKGAALSHDSDTIQFYASDRKFIPVPLNKKEDNLIEWEYINPVEGGHFRASSLYYTWLLNDLAKYLWAPATLNHGHRLEDRIGLLGWDDLESS